MDASGNGDGGSLGDIPTRPMRVKVLYTFDTEGKTQCLARFPNTLSIPVVAIDEQSHVGVIELQQCVQAIIAASPEILSTLDNGDFTVYNFDFTEYDTPIVGQGRLSTLLAGTPLGQDKAMITGRVCKNIPALFNNGVKETLEVKFKLTPLSKPAHNDFATNTDTFRSLSPATSAGFDPNVWNTSVQQNKPQQEPSDYFDFDSLTAGGNNGTALLDDMFGMATGGGGGLGGLPQPGGVGVPETPTDSAFAFNPAFSAQSHSAPGSRAGSPIIRPGPSIPNEHLRHQSFSGQPSNFADQSRPGSRASVRSEANPPTHQHQDGPQHYQQQLTQQQNEVFYNEDGQPRKRAKVVQTDWRGKSSFGSKSSDLRVTAATASSMHMFRPIAKRPTAPGADLAPPPRVPTPVPNRMMLPNQHGQQRGGPRSMLRQASAVDSDFMSDADPMSDAMTSPEGSSPSRSITAEGTPMDIPSSPPLVPGFNLPTPSSPALPTLPAQMADSGYMSGSFHSGTIMESLENDEDRSPDEEDRDMAARYRPRNYRQSTFVKTEGSVAGDTSSYPMDGLPHDFNVQLERPGDMNLLPQNNPPLERRGANQGPRPAVPPKQPSTMSSAASPTEAGSRRGSLALPSKPLSRAPSEEQSLKAPPKQKRRPLQRSHTANDSEVGSPAPSDTESRPHGTARSGSSKPRRELIEQRLNQAIARGEMPVFCSHCGAIETPTWRKLYVKTVNGKPGPLDYVEGEGEVVGVQSLETDDDGVTTKFIIRKSMKKTKVLQPGQGFEDINVCNPCGLWFNKSRNMRPEDRWHRKYTSTRTRKKSKRDDSLPTDGMEPQSDAFFTDQIVPEDAIEETNSADDGQAEAGARNEELYAQSRRPRANSLQPQPSRRSSGMSSDGVSRQNAAMQRETQSSPVRFQGSQDSPIELDMTPAKPTRRLLFPSPRQEGEVKSLENDQSLESMSPSTEKEINVNVFKAMISDKENVSPLFDEQDDLSHLFEGSPSAIFKTPLRKTPSKRTPRSKPELEDLLKTPTQGSRKRKPLTPNLNAANNGGSIVNDFMTSPGSARYFLRSTPSRLERTPGGRSVSGGSQGMGIEPSPFSRHLAQMLRDADGMGEAPFTSPSQQYDFSDLPTFGTPGREADWRGLDDILSSEFANYAEDNSLGFDSEQPGGE